MLFFVCARFLSFISHALVCPFISSLIHSSFCCCVSVYRTPIFFFLECVNSSFLCMFFCVSPLISFYSVFTADKMLQFFIPLHSCLGFFSLNGMMGTHNTVLKCCRSLSVTLTETQTQWVEMYFTIFIQRMLNWSLSHPSWHHYYIILSCWIDEFVNWNNLYDNR